MHRSKVEASTLDVGPLKINPATKTAVVNDTALRLTRTEYVVLETLAKREPSAVAPEEILTRIYGDKDHPDTSVIAAHVSRLRKKLQQACPELRFIEAVCKRGYLLTVNRTDRKKDRREPDTPSGESSDAPHCATAKNTFDEIARQM